MSEKPIKTIDGVITQTISDAHYYTFNLDEWLRWPDQPQPLLTKDGQQLVYDCEVYPLEKDAVHE